jgi:hypothetical protein
MNIKIGAFMACTLVVGSFSAFAQAPVPYNVRAGHNIIYMDWSANALSTDTVSVSTLDDTKLGTVMATPEDKATATPHGQKYQHSQSQLQR